MDNTMATFVALADRVGFSLAVALMLPVLTKEFLAGLTFKQLLGVTWFVQSDVLDDLLLKAEASFEDLVEAHGNPTVFSRLEKTTAPFDVWMSLIPGDVLVVNKITQLAFKKALENITSVEQWHAFWGRFLQNNGYRELVNTVGRDTVVKHLTKLGDEVLIPKLDFAELLKLHKNDTAISNMCYLGPRMRELAVTIDQILACRTYNAGERADKLRQLEAPLEKWHEIYTVRWYGNEDLRELAFRKMQEHILGKSSAEPTKPKAKSEKGTK